MAFARAGSRCVQLEREQKEWKNLYTKESEQRVYTSQLEREKVTMTENIKRLKLALRRQENAGSKTTGITGASATWGNVCR